MQPNQPSKLFLNNDHRSSGTADNFQITLDSPIENAKAIVLRTATIPNSSYTIPGGESTFFWYSPAGYVAGVPNWKLNSFTMNCNRVFLNLVQLINQFNSDSVAQNTGLTLSIDPDPTSATYSQYASNAFTYRVTLSSSTVFKLPGWNDTIDPNGNKIGSMYFNLNQRLGFTNQYLGQQAVGSGTTVVYKLVSDSQPNIQRTSCVNIRFTGQNATLSSPLANGGSGLRDIIACIPFNYMYGDIAVYKEPSALGIARGHISNYIKTIGLQLLDDQYQNFELPANAICTFEFDIYY